MIKILGNSSWGSDTKGLISIYNALILSLIDYEDMIYIIFGLKPKLFTKH
jgi:hypothetical protein